MAEVDIMDFDDALAMLFPEQHESESVCNSQCSDELSAALDEQTAKTNKLDNNAVIMNALNTVPVMVDSTDGTQLSLFAAFDAIVKRTNAQFEKIQKIHTSLISTAMQQQLKIKELESEIKNLKVDYRHTQRSCHVQGLVCAHCLAAPALFESSGKFFCSAVCQEQSLLEDWSEC
jgi:hypothetical protein